MGDKTHVNEDFNSGSPIENPGPASYGVFSGSQHFTVTGGTFPNTTNTTNNYYTIPTAPFDFRRIPIGDIDLQHEIRLEKHSGVAEYRRGPSHTVRRLSSAKIPGRRSSVTVATYQGESAEEEWRRDIAKYMTMRHPNIVQIYGAASSGNMHATIFQDDFIPFYNFLGLYRHSHFSTVYICAYADAEFQAARKYINSTLGYMLGNGDCTPFVCRSTGRFCVDLVPSNWAEKIWDAGMTHHQGLELLGAPHLGATVIQSLTTEQYHAICYWELAETYKHEIYWELSQCHDIYIPTLAAVDPGAILRVPFSSEDSHRGFVEIATLPDKHIFCRCVVRGHGCGRKIMANGWTRLTSDYAMDSHSRIFIFLSCAGPGPDWLNQASHIFSRLGISSNFEDYVLLDKISFKFVLSTTAHPPKGYLFLCPEHFHIGSFSRYRWPDRHAYWSLDPAGTERLSWEDAATLGFPRIGLRAVVQGRSWDANVYAGLRQFHQAKGFDPDSQELALHVREPLYQLTSEIVNSPFAHVHGDEQSRDGHNLIRLLIDWDESQDISKSAPDTYDGNISLNNNSVCPSLAEEMVISSTFKLVLNVQFALILFHTLFHGWLVGYEVCKIGS